MTEFPSYGQKTPLLHLRSAKTSGRGHSLVPFAIVVDASDTAVGKFEPPSSRFEHVHIDLIGPLPPSESFRYCLTCVNRFSKWPEAFPLEEISAEAMSKIIYAGWIARFGPPLK
ncbi:integrase catalytic domain-containing protein [Nephila pilipes]|uniref:Integrase catalytic domain-containing protein n=1 Tax=Nephila pilipes TaxID=299642 RepID=A0A8X6I3N0_NEPPI|nr:integrase catalytic domain-containing protein [Nephila pilipes]